MKILKHQVNIICVKYGTKYTSDRVNRLLKMVKRNCSLPFSFYCMTENSIGLDSRVKVIDLDISLDLESYWWKMCLFNLDFKEPTLFFDLDIVIQNNFDFLFEQIDDKLLVLFSDDAGLDNRNTIILPVDNKINTSVIGFIPILFKDLYNNFIRDTDYNIVKYFGIDRFITAMYLDRCKPLSYDYYYYRWKKDLTESKYCTSVKIDGKRYSLAHVPNKHFCIFCQEHPDMYKEMENYFI